MNGQKKINLIIILSILFNQNENDTINKMLPLQFDISQLEPVPAINSISLQLNIAQAYSDSGNINVFYSEISHNTLQ